MLWAMREPWEECGVTEKGQKQQSARLQSLQFSPAGNRVQISEASAEVELRPLRSVREFDHRSIMEDILWQ